MFSGLTELEVLQTQVINCIAVKLCSDISILIV